MARYGVAEAKDGLPALIDKALAGEEVVITRHGRPVVELRAVETTKPKANRAEILARLAELRSKMPQLDISGADLVRQMRDEYRY